MAALDAPDESTSRMDPYDVLEQIGKGAFGAAWIIQTRGNDSNPPRRFVLKKIPLARLSERQRHLSLQERQLVAALRHPYVVPYHRSWIERSHTVCIVMRHCDGGDLASAAWRAGRRRERFPERTLRLWLAQLLSALAYIHSERVIHRDVKTGNVFLTSTGDAMLGDFGLARVGTPHSRNATDDVRATSTVGTPHFMSPEMLRGAEYGFAADVWSLGCVMYELTTLRRPFTAFDMEGLRRKILHSPPVAFIQPGKEGEEDASLYGDGWRATIRSMLRKAPEERPSASELLRVSDMSDAAADADARAREIEAEKEAATTEGRAEATRRSWRRRTASRCPRRAVTGRPPRTSAPNPPGARPFAGVGRIWIRATCDLTRRENRGRRPGRSRLAPRGRRRARLGTRTRRRRPENSERRRRRRLKKRLKKRRGGDPGGTPPRA